MRGGATIGFDTSDTARICKAEYEECDSYFKRSLAPSAAANFKKLHALGLNYLVYDDSVDLSHAARTLRCPASLADRLRSLGVALAVDQLLPFTRFHQERVTAMSARPRVPQASDRVKVLFSVRLWDPSEVSSDSAKEDREKVNAGRIQLVRRLKDEFGDRYVGGISEDSYSATIAPDLLVPRGFHRKRSYLESLRSSDIVVATTGLHGSIGWKFGEYVAFSKPIVTERLNYLVPGRFADGVNYLSYDSIDECVEKVRRLADDVASRFLMSQANERYYFHHLIPEQMLMRAILRANEGCPPVGDLGAGSADGRA